MVFKGARETQFSFSKLFQACFEQKFRYTHTKNEAIVVNVLAVIVIGELKV